MAGNPPRERRIRLGGGQVLSAASRHLVGNIRKVADGYRLRFRRHGEMRTPPERYSTRQEAERAL
jgi:hypothetical protein